MWSSSSQQMLRSNFMIYLLTPLFKKKVSDKSENVVASYSKVYKILQHCVFFISILVWTTITSYLNGYKEFKISLYLFSMVTFLDNLVKSPVRSYYFSAWNFWRFCFYSKSQYLKGDLKICRQATFDDLLVASFSAFNSDIFSVVPWLLISISLPSFYPSPSPFLFPVPSFWYSFLK